MTLIALTNIPYTEKTSSIILSKCSAFFSEQFYELCGIIFFHLVNNTIFYGKE